MLSASACPHAWRSSPLARPDRRVGTRPELGIGRVEGSRKDAGCEVGNPHFLGPRVSRAQLWTTAPPCSAASNGHKLSAVIGPGAVSNRTRRSPGRGSSIATAWRKSAVVSISLIAASIRIPRCNGLGDDLVTTRCTRTYSRTTAPLSRCCKSPFLRLLASRGRRILPSARGSAAWSLSRRGSTFKLSRPNHPGRRPPVCVRRATRRG